MTKGVDEDEDDDVDTIIVVVRIRVELLVPVIIVVVVVNPVFALLFVWNINTVFVLPIWQYIKDVPGKS